MGNDMQARSEILNTVFPVYDECSLALIDFMPHPAQGVSGDMKIVNAARMSFLGDSKGEALDHKLLDYLMEHKHTGPFEHVIFTIRLRAPLIAWWQLARHRTFSLNLQSGRYVPFEEDSFYIPTEWRLQSVSNKQGSEGVASPELSRELTQKMKDLTAAGYAAYQQALKDNISREMARLFLAGFAVYYEGVITVDAHNLMHAQELRTAKEAQYETRKIAEVIEEKIFKPMLPWTWEAFQRRKLKG